MKTPDPIDDPAIPGLFSLSRHGTYLAATNDDHGRAVRLYAWNIEASAAFWGGFHLLEVCLRNALHARLTDLAGRDDWWQSGSCSSTSNSAASPRPPDSCRLTKAQPPRLAM